MSASAWRKSISCWPIATSWCDASRLKPRFVSSSSMSRRVSSREVVGIDVEVRRVVVRVERRPVLVAALEEEELRLGPDGHLVALGLGVGEHLLELHARIAGERRAVGVGDVADDARGRPDSRSPQGSTWKVAGSGWKYMSDFSMRLKPRIEEPSNISSLSRAFSSSAAGIETFFSWPYSSVNCRRTNLTSCSRQRSISSRLSTWRPPGGVKTATAVFLIAAPLARPRVGTRRAPASPHASARVYFTPRTTATDR